MRQHFVGSRPRMSWVLAPSPQLRAFTRPHKASRQRARPDPTAVAQRTESRSTLETAVAVGPEIGVASEDKQQFGKDHHVSNAVVGFELHSSHEGKGKLADNLWLGDLPFQAPK